LASAYGSGDQSRHSRPCLVRLLFHWQKQAHFVFFEKGRNHSLLSRIASASRDRNKKWAQNTNQTACSRKSDPTIKNKDSENTNLNKKAATEKWMINKQKNNRMINRNSVSDKSFFFQI
jgi:hypothetical protein